MSKKPLTIAAAALLAIATGPAAAQEDPATVTMLGGWRTDQGTHMAAFRIVLGEGWKTYWRTPGDAGIPPRIDWSGSDNISAAEIHWPRPGIFETYGSRTIGYEGEVILPVEITPGADGSIRAEGQLQIGVCSDICVPMAFPFAADLPESDAQHPEIIAALALGPDHMQGQSVSGLGCQVDPIEDGMRITATLQVPGGIAPHSAVFEHTDREVWVSESNMSISGRQMTVSADFVPPEAQPFAVERNALVLTLLGDNNSIEITGCPAAAG